MKVASCLALLPALALAAPAAPVERDVAPPGFTVHGTAYGGTGCPQGTLKVKVSPDGKFLPLVFDNFVASIGPGEDITRQRQNCQIALDLLYAPGYSFSVLSSKYVGYAKLDAGVTATVGATYYFSGKPNQDQTFVSFDGPVEGDYVKYDNEAISVWSPCGSEGILNVNSEIRLTSNNARASGVLTTDRIDTKFTHNIYLRWRQC
ncbi:hypothetical protein M501DRAFT_1010707 [Patellaria atrata CBS 101060]|uniref:Secreted protein n=1 Tax=Patellaria atrata CBS 101060 TaxID=1346257 RepID=A0A9P4SBI6_9PEZI|nr:hypothetical protein M501DRAFT_1010707 [Patellaria atrata CBS 101060]